MCSNEVLFSHFVIAWISNSYPSRRRVCLPPKGSVHYFRNKMKMNRLIIPFNNVSNQFIVHSYFIYSKVYLIATDPSIPVIIFFTATPQSGFIQ